MPLEALVDNGHACHILVILEIVESLARFGNIDIVERILNIFVHATYNLEHPLVALEILLVDIGAQRGNHIDGALDVSLIIRQLPCNGIGVTQLGILRVLAAHHPHLLIIMGANMQSGVVILIVGIYIQQEILLASRLDVLELIRQGLIFLEVA